MSAVMMLSCTLEAEDIITAGMLPVCCSKSSVTNLFWTLPGKGIE